MEIKVGTDIVSIGRFKERLEKNRWKFEEDIFLQDEIAAHDSSEHLAGVFAAKESVIKALDLKPGSWKSVKIGKSETGRPEVILRGEIGKKVKNCDVSISHDGEYAIAVSICTS